MINTVYGVGIRIWIHAGGKNTLKVKANIVKHYLLFKTIRLLKRVRVGEHPQHRLKQFRLT
jgi:hypothetical protein